MKKKVLIPLWCLCILYPVLIWSNESQPTPTYTRMTLIHKIVIDPGHGGNNPGAQGLYGALEKAVNLEIAERLAKVIKSRTDAEVILTRHQDDFVDLWDRTRKANSLQADLFISIHCNSAFTREANGIETLLLSVEASDEEVEKLAAIENEGFLLSPNPSDMDESAISVIKTNLAHQSQQQDSLALAQSIQIQSIKVTKARDRGIKQGPFIVLREAKMPAVIVEVGFLSHPVEGKDLLDAAYQKKIADGILEGIISFDRSYSRKARADIALKSEVLERLDDLRKPLTDTITAFSILSQLQWPALFKLMNFYNNETLWLTHSILYHIPLDITLASVGQ